MSAALQGMNSASKQVDESAARIADPQDATDVIKDIVDIKVAETSYKANLATLKTANEMSEELLQIFDEKV